MNENHRKIENYEDEIELIDILRVIWKWKYVIIAGTIFCGVIAAIISFNMAKIYSVDMVLRPGILSIGSGEQNVYTNSSQNMVLNLREQGKNIYIDSAQNIKALGKLLLETYRELVQYFKNEYEMKLDIFKSELGYIKITIKSYKRNVKNIEKRIDELTPEIELIKNNTANLIKERDKLLSKNPKENNILSALLYSNTIQQNLQLSNQYQDEINNYKGKKENELQKIEKSENEIVNKLNVMKNLQFKKDNIQNIQFLQPATSSLYPVKPRILLNVILALAAGLFLMLFLAFFLEYLGKVVSEFMSQNLVSITLHGMFC
ncbi:MAG: hypothetical protein JRE10_08580 [Deltaproteobacteria bacterium]|nr:hypothetical protein [Deltaproteobacteria bacterium]